MPSAEPTTRMFLGIPLPPALREGLFKLAGDLRSNGIDAGNWSRADLYHVTLVFLGEISVVDADTVADLAENIAARHEASPLTVLNIGNFTRSKILWAGIEPAEEQHFGALAGELADAIRQHTQIPIERRPFRAHITLARKLHTSLDTTAQTTRLQSAGLLGPALTAPIDQIALFSSKRVDGRLVYPIERAFRLK